MSFEQSIPFIRYHEGGEVDDPVDRGGHTIYGISARAFPKEQYPQFWNSPTWKKAEMLYKNFFWRKYKLEQMAPHVAVIALDMLVNHNPRDAIKVLQRGLGVKVDGILGPQTRAATWRNDVSVPRILQHRMELYRKIVHRRPKQAKFFPGWAWRTQALNRYSLGIEAGIDIHPNGRMT